jgi:hypothetical protein
LPLSIWKEKLWVGFNGCFPTTNSTHDTDFFKSWRIASHHRFMKILREIYSSSAKPPPSRRIKPSSRRLPKGWIH